MSPAPFDHPSPPEEEIIAPQNQGRLFRFALGASLLSGIYLAFSAVSLPIHQRLLGLIIMGLSVLPSLLWCRETRKGIPIFAILSLTILAVYGLPLLRETSSLAAFPEETITKTCLVILCFQAALLGAYYLTRGRPGRGAFFTEEFFGSQNKDLLLGGLALGTLHSYLSIFTSVIPDSAIGLVRAVCSGAGMISIFVLSKDLGRRELQPRQKTLFLSLFVLFLAFNCATLMLVSGISSIVLAVIGFVAGRRQLPLLFLACLLPTLGLLHNGKQALRDRYWDPATGERHVPQLYELPRFYATWVREGLHLSHEENINLAGKLLDRGSLIQMACLVVDCTPYRQPYLEGATYADIPAQFVPRVFWPDKPLGHVSTNRLAVYYGLQAEDSTAWTTIGFGLLAEAYANFGLLGVGALGLLLGFTYKKLVCLSSESPLLSSAGLFMVMLTAWSFQTEFTLSIWISSLFQACMAVIVIPMVFRRLFG